MVSTKAFETTTSIEGDGFKGVGVVDTPMCCAVKLFIMKRTKFLRSWKKMTFNQIINR
jgi:hypothetical protein